MQVLLSIPNFTSSGSQMVVLNLYEGLKKRGVSVKVVIFNSQYFPDNIVQSDRIVLFAQHKWVVMSFILKCVNLIRLLRKNQVDILHSWDYSYHFWEALACRIVGTKYLYTKKNNSWSFRWHIKSILSSKIAYDQPDMKQIFFSSSIYSKKVLFIPHGIVLRNFPFRLQKRTNRKFIIGNVGNINKNKNQKVIVQSLSVLGKEYELHIFGTGPERRVEDLKREALSLNVINQLVFHGNIPNEQLAIKLKQCNVLVLSSYNEGLPVTLLEAMAIGIPCIASKSGGGTSYILNEGELGNLFEPDDFRSLAELIRHIKINGNDFEYRTKKARKRVEDMFSIEKEVTEYVRMYNELNK